MRSTITASRAYDKYCERQDTLTNEDLKIVRWCFELIDLSRHDPSSLSLPPLIDETNLPKSEFRVANAALMMAE